MKNYILIVLLSAITLSASAKKSINNLKMAPVVESQTPTPNWESPTDADRETIIIDSVEWYSYNKNGVTVQATCAKAKDYGRCHQLKLVIDNNSSESINFDPATAIKGVVVIGNMHERTRDMIDMEMVSHADYMKKVTKSKDPEESLDKASERYLNQTLIKPTESLSAYVNLRRTPKDKLISASINLNGAEYIFNWNIVKEKKFLKKLFHR